MSGSVTFQNNGISLNILRLCHINWIWEFDVAANCLTFQSTAALLEKIKNHILYDIKEKNIKYHKRLMQNFKLALLVMLEWQIDLWIGHVLWIFKGLCFIDLLLPFPHSRLTSTVIVGIFDERWFLLWRDLWVGLWALKILRAHFCSENWHSYIKIIELSNYQN